MPRSPAAFLMFMITLTPGIRAAASKSAAPNRGGSTGTSARIVLIPDHCIAGRWSTTGIPTFGHALACSR